MPSTKQQRAIMARVRKRLFYSDELDPRGTLRVSGRWKAAKKLPTSIQVKKIGSVPQKFEHQIVDALQRLPKQHLRTVEKQNKLSTIKLHGNVGLKRFLHMSPSSAVVNMLGMQGSGAEYLPHKLRKGGVIHFDEPTFSERSSKFENFLRKHIGGKDYKLFLKQSKGAPPEQSPTLTLSHEFAHAYDEARSKKKKPFYEHFARRTAKDTIKPTEYGGTHPAENFAEVYALYSTPRGRKYLKKPYPHSYKAVRRLFQ